MLKFTRVRPGDPPPSADEWNRLCEMVEKAFELAGQGGRAERPRVAKWAKTTSLITGRTSDTDDGFGNAQLYTSVKGKQHLYITMKIWNRAAASVPSGRWIKVCWVDDEPYVDWEEC